MVPCAERDTMHCAILSSQPLLSDAAMPLAHPAKTSLEHHNIGNSSLPMPTGHCHKHNRIQLQPQAAATFKHQASPPSQLALRPAEQVTAFQLCPEQGQPGSKCPCQLFQL